MPEELAPLEIAQINSLEADLRLLDDRIKAADDGRAPRPVADVLGLRRYRSQLAEQLRRTRRLDRTT